MQKKILNESLKQWLNMRKLWTTKDIMYYYGKTDSQVKQWRKDGLKHTHLSSGYVYEYSDIIDYLMED